MVQNKNWQNRVESAQTRRTEAKQRKQQRENKGVYKAQVLELFSFLDRHNDKLLREWRDEPVVIHLWTDSRPEGDDYEQNGGYDGNACKKKMRRRSVSFSEASTPSPGKKIRGRSSSFNELQAGSKRGKGRSSSFSETHAPGSGKFSGRSRSTSQTSLHDSEENAPLLCRRHFFTGKCSATSGKGGRKGGAGCGYCAHVHFQGYHQTLANVVLSGSHNGQAADGTTGRLNVAKCILSEASDAAVSALDAAEDADTSAADAIGMIYHLPVGGDADERKEVADVTRLSAAISKSLSRKNCSIGSVVYVTLNNILLFDRHRDGLFLSEEELQSVLYGNGNKWRSMSSLSEHSEQEQSVRDRGQNPAKFEPSATSLPGQILEFIVTFLPDAGMAAMALVCQDWYDEIGQTSPELWRHLLERRSWPGPTKIPPPMQEVEIVSDDSIKSTPKELHRDAFISHYGVLRDVNAIKRALYALNGPGESVGEKEAIVQEFYKRRGAPQYPNGCIGVRIWSPTRVLGAFHYDCTLRLFEAVAKRTMTESSCSHGCREVVCVRAAPFPISKKRCYSLVAMDLDDDMVGCLCQARSSTRVSNEFFLTGVGREDFLCAGGGGSNDGAGPSELGNEVLVSMNVREAVLNFLLSCDEMDHRLLRLYDFLAEEEGDISEVDVSVTKNIVACGHGRFMLEVAISLPVLGSDDESDTVVTLLARKLFLVSAAAGAIVWMGDSVATGPLAHEEENVSLAGLRASPLGPRVDETLLTSCVAIASPGSPGILSIDIGQHGEVHSVQTTQAFGPSEFVLHGVVEEEREASAVHTSKRAVVMTSSDIVVGNNFCHTTEEDEVMQKCVVCFHPRSSQARSQVDARNVGSTLVLEGGREIVQMEVIRDKHVLAICRILQKGSDVGLHLTDTHPNALWLGNVDEQPNGLLYAVIIHVPTRMEIERVSLGDLSFVYPNDLPICFSAVGNCVAVGVACDGLILTGDDIRAVGESARRLSVDDKVRTEKRGKKKSKRKSNKGGKKDGFVRGRSMRG